jgi:hypothetical protein
MEAYRSAGESLRAYRDKLVAELADAREAVVEVGPLVQRVRSLEAELEETEGLLGEATGGPRRRARRRRSKGKPTWSSPSTLAAAAMVALSGVLSGLALERPSVENIVSDPPILQALPGHPGAITLHPMPISTTDVIDDPSVPPLETGTGTARPPSWECNPYDPLCARH